MPRPQIRRRRDKPTSSVGRDESINHGIVIPHAERLRARRPATLSFIFASCWKVLGKYSVLAYSKNDPVSPPIAFHSIFLFTIFLYFFPLPFLLDLVDGRHRYSRLLSVLFQHLYPWTLRRVTLREYHLREWHLSFCSIVPRSRLIAPRVA